MTHEELIAIYARKTAAHAYIYGFVLRARLYYAKLTWEELQGLLKKDRAAASKGGMKKIRVRGSAAAKAELIASGKAIELGGAEMLEAEDQFNKGEHFERIITELMTDKKWVKDSVPFWVAGDIRVDGEELQIKLDEAELTNEKVIGKLLAM